MKVQVVDTNVQIITGNAKKTDKPYRMHIQAMYLHFGGVLPDKFESILETPKDTEGKPLTPVPYPVGMYTLDIDKSIKVVQGKITLSPVLIPYVEPKKVGA